MATGLDWLVKLDSMAVRPGDGLHPKLAELLASRRVDPDVATLPSTYASSGLEAQSFTQDDLEAAGIPSIGSGLQSQEAHSSAAHRRDSSKDKGPITNQK